MAPANLTATPLNAQNVFLSWSPIADAGATYVVFKGTAPGTETTLSSTSPAGATTYLDEHNAPNSQLCYFVKAVVNGQVSPASNEACTITPSGPDAPTGVTAVAVSATGINVSWNPVGGAIRYYVFESVGGGPFNAVGSVGIPLTTFTVENLTPATTYTFRVKTLVPGGLFSDFSAPATATTFSLGLESYYRFDEKTGTTALDSAPARRDGVLQSGATLVTVDQAPVLDPADHNPSHASFPTATANMSAPGSVAFTAFGDASISLWVKLPAAPGGALSIIGRRAAGCGAILWQLGQDATSGLNFRAGSTTSFGRTLAAGDWTQIGVAQHGSLIQLYINGVQVASSTAFAAGTPSTAPLQVGDVGGCGNGGALDVDEVKVFSRFVTATEMAALGTRPPAPVNLTVTETHSTFFRFTWDAVPGADHYLVYKGSASGAEVFFTSNQTTTFLADHLSPSQTTFWKVVTVRGGLMSVMSSELSATTLPPPPAPTGLTATLDPCCTPSRVDLSWNAVTGAVQYVIFQSTSGGPFTPVAATLPPVTSFQVANLAAGTTYAFEVATKDDGGILGAPSAPVSVTTP
ncbi:MAG TPA: fibronectin type III domain-containing protein [Kofleriaceae bacterium]|nr:fibronectin type III domain-containing protein [Kofleriaceae bacterium]